VAHLLGSTGESLQVGADLGYLPELLNLREGIGQGDCLGADAKFASSRRRG
jgi:hypothetical protein